MAIKKSDLYSSLWAPCDELRGGMDASQYKDYVLFMLFIKYISDKYGDSDDFAPPVVIAKGASFKDMAALKGNSDIGNLINTQVIQPLIDANSRLARSDFPDFNDSNKLGDGAQKVEKLGNLIAICENPALDFSQNRAENDDILGDAYEYLMRHFATESGKSKGQFYTPSEVSRIMAKAIGISPANSKAATTAYDPTCGSGSLLLKVAAEAGKALAVDGPGKQRPYLRTKNVFDGRIDIADVLTMPMTDDQFGQFGLRNGDVLLNEGQSLELVGRCAMYQGEYPEPCAIQNQLIRFRAKAGVSGVFASYVFRFCQQSGVFARVALRTTSIAHLGGSRFQRLRLAWPKSEPEQSAIATALSDVDGLLGGLDRLIPDRKDLKQAAMQQLLTGQTRLAGFHGEWEVKSLATICSMKSGEGITSASIDQFSKYPCYGGNGLRGYTTRFTHEGGYALVGRSEEHTSELQSL